MGSRNFYVVLGISPQADQDAIRSAYRALAKRYHPDHAGPGGASRFQEVDEAYRVLSDPEGRRAHDDELDLTPRASAAGEPLSNRGWPPVEPLAAEPFSLRRRVRSGRPFLEHELLDWTTRHFRERRLPESGRRRRIDVRVILSWEEAERGGMLPIQIPGSFPCPACGGWGQDWLFDCPRCSGEGAVDESATLEIHIPPFARDGTVWTVPVHEAGVDLRVHVRVETSGWGR